MRMDPNISTFIQENKHILKSDIDLTKMKDFIDHYLPALALSHNASNEPDFYDELVKEENDVFFLFLEALKKNNYKIEAEWIEANLKKFENNETKSPSKGLCLVINNIKFDQNEKNLKDRQYSVIDENALKIAFTKIGFKVYVKQNLKAAEIMEELKSFCTSSLFDYSSYVVVILTHGDIRGNRDVLYGTDMELVYKDDIIVELNSTDCENMLEKPKIVFFQACRGQKEYLTAQGLETDAIESETSIPEKRITFPSKIINTTIVHSALPGHKCHRLKNKGSVFCQTLARVFERDHKEQDLNAMLVTVNKEIREQYPGEEEFIHIEQIGVTESIRFGDTLTNEQL